MHRVVGNCIAAAPLDGWPDCIPQRRRTPAGSKGAGLRYEVRVGRTLQRLLPVKVESGKWFSYLDGGKRWYCQPDHYAVFADQVLVVECKLSEKLEGLLQINQLYRPVLQRHFDLPVTGVLACKVLRYCQRPLEDPREALQYPGANFVWHHLG